MNKYEQSFFGYAILGYLSDLTGSEFGSLVWWILALISIILGLIKERTES